MLPAVDAPTYRCHAHTTCPRLHEVQSDGEISKLSVFDSPPDQDIRKHALSPSTQETSPSDHHTGTESSTAGSVDLNGEADRLAPRSSTTCSTQQITTPSSISNSPYATDALCSRDMALWMLDDFVTRLYPLIPVIHRPTFRRSIATNQDNADPDLLGLIIGMCAATVGAMPSRFAAYRNHDPPLPFESRKAFIDHAYTVLLTLRGPDYFDQISYQKFATSYLFDIAFFQIGNANRARMVEVECLQLGRMLNLHRITEYRGLNHIETQLRKKGFWLLFYSYVHGQVRFPQFCYVLYTREKRKLLTKLTNTNRCKIFAKIGSPFLTRRWYNLLTWRLSYHLTLTMKPFSRIALYPAYPLVRTSPLHTTSRARSSGPQ